MLLIGYKIHPDKNSTTTKELGVFEIVQSSSKLYFNEAKELLKHFPKDHHSVQRILPVSTGDCDGNGLTSDFSRWTYFAITSKGDIVKFSDGKIEFAIRTEVSSLKVDNSSQLLWWQSSTLEKEFVAVWNNTSLTVVDVSQKQVCVIRHITITNCPFRFVFSHLPKPLFSMWATFCPHFMLS